MTRRYGQEAKDWTVAQTRARADELTDVAVVKLAKEVYGPGVPPIIITALKGNG